MQPKSRLTRFRMSFWKQLPPKPTLVFKNLGPMRLSVPMHLATSWTSAPVASHSAEMLFIELILWASMALAVSLLSSALQRLEHLEQ